MMVRVVAYATLRKYLESPLGEPVEVELPEGAQLADLIRQLGMPIAEVKQAFLNGRRAHLQQALREGDKVALFPAVAGG